MGQDDAGGGVLDGRPEDLPGMDQIHAQRPQGDNLIMDETVLDIHIQSPECLPGVADHRANMIMNGLGSAQLKTVRLTKETPAQLETGQRLAGMLPVDPAEFPKSIHRAAPGAVSIMEHAHDSMRDRIDRLSPGSPGQHDG